MESHNLTNQHEFNTSKWYSITGRISRLQFAGSVLACLIPQIIWQVVLLITAIAIIFGSRGTYLEGLPTYFSIVVIIGLLVTFVPFFVYSSIIYPMRRLHDLNQSGWWALLSLVPYINYAFLLYLAIVEGSEEYNQYGAPPKPNTKIHYVVFYTTLTLLVFVFLYLQIFLDRLNN